MHSKNRTAPKRFYLALVSLIMLSMGIASCGGGTSGVAIDQSTALHPTSAALIAGAPGGPGAEDGVGAVARFTMPSGITKDTANNLYVTDNHAVRKITPAGDVLTFAGAVGAAGSADGNGQQARFNNPIGVASDAAGNLYVADKGNAVVRKIAPDGQVTTFAGVAGIQGRIDGAENNARFNVPEYLAVDNSGNVYVTDRDTPIFDAPQKPILRKITPDGNVTTIEARQDLGLITAIATDVSNNLYTGFRDGAITKTAPDGTISMVGTLVNAFTINPNNRCSYASGLAVNGDGSLYITVEAQQTINQLNPVTGDVVTLAGSPGTIVDVTHLDSTCLPSPGSADGAGPNAQFDRPKGIVLDALGNAYIADSGNYSVRKLTSGGSANAASFVTTIAGQSGKPSFADGNGVAARLNRPYGVVADTFGNLYVSDTYNHTIRKISPTGDVSTLAGKAGQPGYADGVGSSTQFYYPRGLAIDDAGNLYVADTNNRAIRKITPSGEVTTLAGTGGVRGHIDGAGQAARFDAPWGVARDQAGNLYVTESLAGTIRKITSGGIVSTFAGTAGTNGYVDGSGAIALFNAPAGIAVDTSGNLYVADSLNNNIRKISATGIVTTLAGVGASTNVSQNGLGADAPFSSPKDIAIDSSGNLYVTEGNASSKIYKVTPAQNVTTLADLQADFAGGNLPDRRNPAGMAWIGNKLVVLTEAALVRVTFGE